MTDLQQLRDAIIRGDRKTAVQLTHDAIEEGMDVKTTLDAMVAGMSEIGRRFQANEAYVPEMLIAARAMKESLVVLEPLLVEAGVRPELTAVVGTVEGDLHDIGKNLVGMMWKGANFEVIDLGSNVAPEMFVAAAREHNAQIVGLSALLTTTMPAMKLTVQALREANLPHVKVIIGGAPITRQYAKEIGADGFAPDAASAVDEVRRLLAA